MLRQSCFLFATALFFASATPARAQEFPDGPGKEILLSACNSCHTPVEVTHKGRTALDWEDLVHRMIEHGAELTDEEFPVLVDYLAKNFPVKTTTAPPGSTWAANSRLSRLNRLVDFATVESQKSKESKSVESPSRLVESQRRLVGLLTLD